jgi:glycosyltransferase involved in cell wall biosynthesis
MFIRCRKRLRRYALHTRSVPRVTVIIATYNWSSVLRYAIGSVLRQTFRDFELLVVGDACTDDSEAVVASFGDPRVRWINLPTNFGHQSGPNNEGLRQARGELIAYLGHDDLWLPHHLEAIVAAIEGSDLAYSLGMNVGGDGEFLWPTIPQPRSGMFASPLCMVHRKRVTDAIGGWRSPRDVATSPDVDLWQRAQKSGCAFTFVPRLTAIKFPASHRRDVYATRPSHEQEAWTQRIESEPNLEATLLVRFLTAEAVPIGVPYRELFRHFIRQTLARIRMRLARVIRNRGNLDDIRRFKGLG